MKWEHFPRYWPSVRGIHRSPVNSPHKGQWRRALMFSLIGIWIDIWVNNRTVDDLSRHSDVTVISNCNSSPQKFKGHSKIIYDACFYSFVFRRGKKYILVSNILQSWFAFCEYSDCIIWKNRNSLLSDNSILLIRVCQLLSDIGFVKCSVPQGSVLGPLFFLLYINDIYRAVGCNAVRLFADDTSLLSYGLNLNNVIIEAKELFDKLYHWCVTNKLSINSNKTNFVLFHMKNKPVPNDFDSIQTNHMTIGRVKTVNYLGLVIDENLYWNAHVDFVCASLVKYFGIFNHIKSFITSRIARQLYFAFINSRISYGIEVYGHCADEYLSKLQTLQNKLLKLMLKLDRRTSTNQLHRNISLLKAADIHTVSVLCFVNNCRAARCPETFCNYYQARQTERELRNKDHLDVPWARTDMGLSSWNIKGARLWNENFPAVNPYLY